MDAAAHDAAAFARVLERGGHERADEQQRRIDVALDFLAPGRRYRAEIYRDGEDADYRTNPRSIVIEQRNVTSADRFAARIAPGGGTAVRFVPLGR